MKCLSFEMENLIHINVGDFLHVEKPCRRCVENFLQPEKPSFMNKNTFLRVEKPCCIYVTRFL